MGNTGQLIYANRQKWALTDGEFFGEKVDNTDETIPPITDTDTCPIPSNQPPTKVTGLVSSLITSTSFQLDFDPALDPDGTVASYNINLDGVLHGQTSLTSYSPTGLVTGSSVSWTVIAVDNEGLSGPVSNALTVQLLPETTYLLDDLATPVGAAFSFRKLASAMTNAIRIRRISDSDIAIVLFDDNDEVSMDSPVNVGGTLGDWIGTSDAKVVLWYDQSGNGNDLEMTSTDNQPYFMTNGNFFLSSGKPSIDFNDHYLKANDSTGISFSGEMSAHCILEQSGVTAYDTVFGKGPDQSSREYELGITGAEVRYGDKNETIEHNFGVTGFRYISFDRFTDHVEIHVNDTLFSAGYSGTPANNSSDLLLGEREGDDNSFVGNVSELILFKDNASTERTIIYDDQTSHYE